jgi:hypothetical protein
VIDEIAAARRRWCAASGCAHHEPFTDSPATIAVTLGSLVSAFMSGPWRARYSKQTVALAELAPALMELARVLMTGFADPGWATGR